jgi:hypothetical protein
VTGPTQFIGTSLDSSNLLNRGAPSPASSTLSPTQIQVDQLIGDFSRQASDWKTLSAMLAGGLAYQWARVGAMSSSVRAGFEPLRKTLSIGLGLGTEVTAFEMTNRSLASLTGESSLNRNLWRWEGQDGIRHGLVNSLITFGSLKGAGRLAQGENIIVQHMLQDTGMVLAHNISGHWGLTPRPTGTLSEQFFHAEATNLQLGAGMALGHALSGEKLLSIEKALALQIQSKEILPFPLLQRRDFEPVFAMVGDKISGQIPSSTEKIPTILAMSAPADGRGGRGAARRTDLEDYKSAKRQLALWTDDSTLKILRRTTYLNFKKVLTKSAKTHYNTVISLIRLAEDGHLWAFDVLTEAAKAGVYAVNAVEGLAQRGFVKIYDSLARAAVGHVNLIEMLERLGVGGHEEALILLKNMEAASFATEVSKDDLIRGFFLLARNKNEPAFQLLIRSAKTFPPAVNALYELAMAGRKDAEKALASLDSQWIIRASKKNRSSDLDVVLYQLAKYGNTQAQMALMEGGREKCGLFFQMAQLSEEGLTWATEWLTMQAETNPRAEPLLQVLAKEGHQNAQKILRNKKASETDDSEGNGGLPPGSLFSMNLGLAALFGEKRFQGSEILSSGFPLPDIFPRIGQGPWSVILPAIGLGILVIAGIGVSAWLRRAKQEAWYQSSPYSKMLIPLTAQEREILKPLFDGKDPPSVLTGRDWLKIENAFFHQTHTFRGSQLFIKKSRPRDLFMKIQGHVEALKKKGNPSTEGGSTGGTEEDSPFIMAWSQTVDSKNSARGKSISLFDYREDLELQAVYRHLTDTFPSKKDVGEFLRDTMTNSDPFIRERHVRIYELHIRSLLRMNSPRFSPWMIEEICKGMAVLETLRRDSVLNVKSTAAMVYPRLQDLIAKYLPSLAQKN